MAGARGVIAKSDRPAGSAPTRVTDLVAVLNGDEVDATYTPTTGAFDQIRVGLHYPPSDAPWVPILGATVDVPLLAQNTRAYMQVRSVGQYGRRSLASNIASFILPDLDPDDVPEFVVTINVPVVDLGIPPALSVPILGKSAFVDSAFTYTFGAGTFTDADVGDVLTYTAALASGGALPAWLTFTGATRNFAGTPAAGDVGSLTVRVTATDTFLHTATADFPLPVRPNVPVTSNLTRAYSPEFGITFSSGTEIASTGGAVIAAYGTAEGARGNNSPNISLLGGANGQDTFDLEAADNEAITFVATAALTQFSHYAFGVCLESVGVHTLLGHSSAAQFVRLNTNVSPNVLEIRGAGGSSLAEVALPENLVLGQFYNFEVFANVSGSTVEGLATQNFFVKVDGVATAHTPFIGTTTSVTFEQIGRTQASTGPFDGKHGPMLLYSAVKSAANAALIEAWGLAWSSQPPGESDLLSVDFGDTANRTVAASEVTAISSSSPVLAATINASLRPQIDITAATERFMGIGYGQLYGGRHVQFTQAQNWETGAPTYISLKLRKRDEAGAAGTPYIVKRGNFNIRQVAASNDVRVTVPHATTAAILLFEDCYFEDFPADLLFILDPSGVTDFGKFKCYLDGKQITPTVEQASVGALAAITGNVFIGSDGSGTNCAALDLAVAKIWKSFTDDAAARSDAVVDTLVARSSGMHICSDPEDQFASMFNGAQKLQYSASLDGYQASGYATDEVSPFSALVGNTKITVMLASGKILKGRKEDGTWQSGVPTSEWSNNAKNFSLTSSTHYGVMTAAMCPEAPIFYGFSVNVQNAHHRLWDGLVLINGAWDGTWRYGGGPGVANPFIIYNNGGATAWVDNDYDAGIGNYNLHIMNCALLGAQDQTAAVFRGAEGVFHRNWMMLMFNDSRTSYSVDVSPANAALISVDYRLWQGGATWAASSLRFVVAYMDLLANGNTRLFMKTRLGSFAQFNAALGNPWSVAASHTVPAAFTVTNLALASLNNLYHGEAGHDTGLVTGEGGRVTSVGDSILGILRRGILVGTAYGNRPNVRNSRCWQQNTNSVGTARDTADDVSLLQVGQSSEAFGIDTFADVVARGMIGHAVGAISRTNLYLIEHNTGYPGVTDESQLYVGGIHRMYNGPGGAESPNIDADGIRALAPPYSLPAVMFPYQTETTLRAFLAAGGPYRKPQWLKDYFDTYSDPELEVPVIPFKGWEPDVAAANPGLLNGYNNPNNHTQTKKFFDNQASAGAALTAFNAWLAAQAVNMEGGTTYTMGSTPTAENAIRLMGLMQAYGRANAGVY